MSKVETAYVRKGKVITQVDVDPPDVIAFKSINAAKKESRKLQQAHGGLGRGFVKVER